MPYTLGLAQMSVIPAKTLGTPTSPDDKLATPEAIYALLALMSSAASAFHGYRRNQSIGWAIVWGLLGGIFPVFTPTIALAQGFGKPRKAVA